MNDYMVQTIGNLSTLSPLFRAAPPRASSSASSPAGTTDSENGQTSLRGEQAAGLAGLLSHALALQHAASALTMPRPADGGDNIRSIAPINAAPINGTVSLSAEATGFAKATNAFLDFLGANSGIMAPQLLTRARDVINTSAPALAQIGVTVASDGSLSVDQEKLSRAAESNPTAVENALSGPTGVAASLGRFAQETGISAQNLFALAIPAGMDVSALPGRLAQAFSGLFGDGSASGQLVNLSG